MSMIKISESPTIIIVYLRWPSSPKNICIDIPKQLTSSVNSRPWVPSNSRPQIRYMTFNERLNIQTSVDPGWIFSKCEGVLLKCRGMMQCEPSTGTGHRSYLRHSVTQRPFTMAADWAAEQSVLCNELT